MSPVIESKAEPMVVDAEDELVEVPFDVPRPRRLATGARIALGTLAVAAALLLWANDKSEQVQVNAPVQDDALAAPNPTPAVSFDGGVCDPQPTPRPEDAESAAAWDAMWGSPDALAEAIAQAEELGWQRSMAQGLSDDLMMCGWTKYTSLEAELHEGIDPQAVDSEGRVLFYDAPDGALVGYQYGTTFVSLDEARDPGLEERLTARFGCVVTTFRPYCEAQPGGTPIGPDPQASLTP